MNSLHGNNLLMAYVGDDFTGSTDAMESLAREGIRTVLFTEFPSRAELEKYPGLRAFGVAAMTRSLPVERIAENIRPIFRALRASGAPIVHYKTCSTFDSSPTVGSIGRVIDVGMEEFSAGFVPVVVGAPALGRYCVFGNLFARCGGEPEIYRLDRHPSMSRHPVTPMDEADLRRHLARQTTKSISLLDVVGLESPIEETERRFEVLARNGGSIVLMDAMNDRHLLRIGTILAERGSVDHPLFVVGSSGVEAALCARWAEMGVVRGARPFERVGNAGPMVAVCGSCSPVTGQQIRWAIGHGFEEIAVNVGELAGSFSGAVAAAAEAIGRGRSVCVHTGGGGVGESGGLQSSEIGVGLGKILAGILKASLVRRVLVAGGDTSSQIARVLKIRAVEMIGELTRGSPLCRVSAGEAGIDGLEITFKGGQIGSDDFFGLVENGPE